VRRGHLLYCHSKGAANTFLPGGHVEFNEGAPGALKREIGEEMGLDAVVGRFLGAVEHTFTQEDELHCEINLVFDTDIPGLSADTVPSSREGKLEFGWLPLVELSGSPLEPEPLRALLPQWLGEDTAHWASTYPV
jgi:8-oxo-dGTP pyrophosphatase MutT (NUDIX family)